MTIYEIEQTPVAVLRFTASWCPPCKALAPVFDEVAAENPGVTVFVVDVDDHPDIASHYSIRGIPTLLRVEEGVVTKQLGGARPKPEVEDLFK
jgi:thioredoxin 1